jgi:O-antigen/teichoic acid export membrane protein
LSAASFAAGLILIRKASNSQYGYFILASNGLLLLASLQNAFLNPPVSNRLVRLERNDRSELVGSLYRVQREMLFYVVAISILVVLGLWMGRMLNGETGPLALATLVAAVAVLHREYFRIVMFAYRHAVAVLRTDVVYAAMLVCGVLLATLTTAPATAAVLALGLAAVVSGRLLTKTLTEYEPWNAKASSRTLREIAPLAVWSATGAAVHWTFSQGYIYLVVGTLDVTAVAAIAATRLLMMPMNLISSGVGSLMLPLASGWLHQHGAAVVWRRLGVLACGLATMTLAYFLVVWTLRDWIFAAVLKKHFAQQDELLLLWGAIVLLIVVRDQLVYLLAAQSRFRSLTLVTLGSAIISLTASYFAMLRFGVSGALMGVLVGELINVVGIVAISIVKRTPPPLDVWEQDVAAKLVS